MTKKKLQDLYTPAGAAELTGLSRDWIMNACRSGAILAHRNLSAGGRVATWGIPLSSLKRWKKERRASNRQLKGIIPL